MTGKTVCVLGGGSGGVVVANLLRKYLDPPHEIILVDKNPEHVYAPSFLWVLAGKRRPAEIKKSLHSLERKGIRFINSEVKKILPDKNLVRVNDEEITYDYLIVALGAESNMNAISGLNEAAINLYSLEGILQLKEQLEDFNRGELVILIPSMPYKCPAAPYEAAFILDSQFRKKQFRDEVNISIYTFETLPMPTAGPQIGQMLKELLGKRAINFNPGIAVESINPENKEVIFKDGSKKRADLLITIPPHKSPDVVKEALLTNEAGWMPVDKKTLKTEYNNIFAIGDIATIKLEGKYKPDKPLMLPKAGVFAHKEAHVVAKNIASEIKGTFEQKEFDGKGSCFLELGNGVAGFAAGSFFELPHPKVNMKKPSRFWLYLKILFEKYWLRRWF